MRRVLMVLLATAAIWSGYWLVSARLLESGLQVWLEERRSESWVADAGKIGVTGFPTAFNAAITGLTLADPDTGLAWAAPEFRFAAKSYKPHEIHATWPDRQQLSTPDQKIDIGAQRMQAALHFRPGPALALTHGQADLDGFTLISTAGWTADMAGASLVADAEDGAEARYSIAFEASQMRPPAPLVAMLDRAGILPDLFDHLRLQALVDFDTEWDRHAIEDRRPQITRLDLTMLDAKWGDLAVQAAGALDVDADGLPTGDVTLRATNWRDMIAIARASGRLSDGVADQVEATLGLIAGLSGRPETIDVPLRFARGLTWLGPVPLGPAPDFSIR
ncbi:High-affinity K+ transport system, ATPase chain B [Rhodovulum sp. P5]|uniref:DUF2125 domain-containing protein n=1 Tax=Rhodovulum sp. P5 TaxID=1564506 RepID=UPI0009C3ACA8|nr:DUF2125 domain-containing protein [Rhodovulum sp. P5]ARE39560.1 High-affinity K+ transport system, ATPase chain B [Rhodovulum sp. P5]